MPDQKAVNRWTARVVPLILGGIIAYVSWVVTGPLCVNYLLKSRHGSIVPPRRGTAVAILVIFYFLLFFVISTYARVLYTIAVDPGFVPRSSAFDEHKNPIENKNKKVEKTTDPPGIAKSQPYSRVDSSRRPDDGSEGPGLAEFYNKDVFVCEGDGRPPWCTVCKSWKPDRAHHCREVARCVRKMDHFCPWVGGIVSETNHKFFFQFVAWTCTFCLFVLVVMAYFVAEVRGKASVNTKTPSLDVNWAVALGFGAFFFLFTGGMTGSTMEFILRNTTSVENLSRKVKVWSLAVYLPRPPAPNSITPYRIITYPLSSSIDDRPSPQRTFAILFSRPGESPYDLGPYQNFVSVMGETVWDWILPLRRSPATDHSSGESAFALGPEFQKMKQSAGLVPGCSTTHKEPSVNDPSSKEKRRRRGRRRSKREEKAEVLSRNNEKDGTPVDNSNANEGA